MTHTQDSAILVERIAQFSDDDLAALCEAADAAIIDGGGFGWVNPPGRVALEAYFRGLLLVPGRELFAARVDGGLVGSVQLLRPPRSNEAQAFAASLTHSFVAPYARGHGIARSMTLRLEESARALGYHVLNLDVRETQEAAIALYESLGYIRWGVHPCYARVGGRTIKGIHYFKDSPATRPDCGMTGLTLYPAIDLKDGACVRLRRGEMDQATVYADDPAAQARVWEAAGFTWLHVVDLNGAFAGRSVNGAAVRAILGATGLPVQLGGGIRDTDAIGAWLDAGVRRVILGSAAAKQPALVRTACRDHPGRIVIGIDARDGMVATEGWAETGSLPAADLARRFEDSGAAAIVFTDIGRDGMLQGLNLAQTAAIADAVRLPVIASGGVGGLDHLQSLRRLAHPGIEGVVVGRALYDGRIDPAAALALLSGGASPG